MKRTILLTGGAGFIGSNFVRYIARNNPDYLIAVLDALTYAGSVDNIPPEMLTMNHRQFKFWYGDVCNAELVDTLVSEADVIVHFAAETHVTRSIYDNVRFFHTDVMGTQTVANAVLKAADRVERLIHISTSEVYGTAERDEMDESHPLNPMNPYASAKCGADRLVYSYWTTYRIPAVILRPFNNFGPRQHLEKVVPRFVTSALLGEPLTVHGDGSAARDFVFVEDVCRAIDLVIHARKEKVVGEVFNVASGQHRSILSVAQDIIEIMGSSSSDIRYISDRPGQVTRHTGSWTKINRVLGWEPKVDWEEGLRQTVDWFRANRAAWQKQVWMRSIPVRLPDGRIEFQ